MTRIEELAERVDRLLLRHAEVQRTNALLLQQVGVLTQERDSLRSRLNAARHRLDVLLERLPPQNAPGASTSTSGSASSTAWGGSPSRVDRSGPSLDASNATGDGRVPARKQGR